MIMSKHFNRGQANFKLIYTTKDILHIINNYIYSKQVYCHRILLLFSQRALTLNTLAPAWKKVTLD